LYLLDANVLITAHNSYYPIEAVPEYWEWLIYMGTQGHVKMPFEIFEEVKDGPNGDSDPLFAWLQQARVMSLTAVMEPWMFGVMEPQTGR
jgi:hypothetical protein